jgi:cell division transport system permease protein
MSACIFLFGLFLALVMNFRYIVHTAEEGVAVVVYFNEGTKQEQIDEIGQKIQAREEVAEVKYISADQAWEEFRDDYLGGDEALAEGFRNQDNPLANSANYQVYLKNVEEQSQLVEYIQSLDGVRSVSQSQSAEKTLSTFNKLIGYVSLAIVFILLAVAFFLISNTITMGISVRQEEIGIMKLIGATDFFVRAPFVIEGILLGIVGAAIPMGILYVLYNKVIEFVMTKFHLLSGFLQFLDVSHVFRILLPVGVGLGIGIGFIGSMISVRKHLRV